MAGEWTYTTLGSLTDFLSGGTPSKGRTEYWGGSIPWVSAKDMKRFRLDDTEDHVTEEGVANGTRLVPSGTVLLLARGMTLLNNVPICVANRPMTFNQDVKALRPKPHVRDDFLLYLLLGNKERLLSLVDLAGHGTGRLNSDELKALDVVLPPEPEQRAIAHILGTLDDKIELNRRMNETLEAMARALFQSWFVDFEPVRAKMEGRWRPGQALPGLPAHLYDLFPDRLVDSELGEIPEGWEVGCIESEFNLTMGQSPPGHTYNEEGRGLPFYQGRTDFGFRFPTRRVYCTAPTRFAKAGDTLICVRAPVGDTNMASEDCAIGRGVAAARHKSGSCSYTYFCLQALEATFHRFEAEGTVFGSIGKKDFHAIAYVAPSGKVVSGFEGLIAPVDARIGANESESRILVSLRDTLLPRLISGELRVNYAERFVGEVVS
jgi:type I restriction enzyme, S subunit